MDRHTDNIIRFPGTAAVEVEATAAGWLARMTSGSIGLGEIAEFEYWRAASPDHDRVYRELEQMWDLLGRGATPRGLPGRIMAGLRRRRGAVSGWGMRLGQLAAAIAVLLLGAQYVSTWRYDYHTAPGETRRVALADGSVVHMMGGTALDARITATGARTIDFARGEAFFEVVHDAARPFTVNVGGGAVHDIGTGFSVGRTGRSVTVAVQHGAVSVVAAGLSDVLAPGDQLSFNLYAMGRKRHVDVDMIAAWRRGLYIVEGKPLGEVLGDIDTYYPGRIVVTSRTLATRRVNAVVQFAHTEAWLRALDKTPGVSVRHWGPFTIVGDSST